MKRQRELNETTIEKAKKEYEKIMKLHETIKKAEESIDNIKRKNAWMRYTNEEFTKNTSEEMELEFCKYYQFIS